MVESGLIQGAQQFLTSAGLGQQQPQQMQGGGQFQSQPQGLQQQQPMFTSSSLQQQPQQQPQQSLLQPQQQQSFQQQQQPYGSSGVGVGGSSFVQQGTGTGVGMGQSSLLSSSSSSVLPQHLQQQPLTSVGSYGVQQQPQSIQSFQQQQPQSQLLQQQQQPQSIQSSSSFYQQPQQQQQQQQPLSQSWLQQQQPQQPIQQQWSSSSLSSTRAAPIASSSYSSSSTLTSSGYGNSGQSSGIDSGYSNGTSTGQQKFTQQQRQSPTTTSTTGTTDTTATTTTSQFPLDGFNLLLQDQRDIIDLYDNHYMTEKDPVHKRQILSLLIEELCIHSSIDEVIVFPLIELLLVPDGKRLSERNYWQHLLNRIHFQKILEMDMNDKMFDSSVQHMMVYMRDQMKNNEFDVYAHAKQKMTQEQLAVLYRLVEAARQLAPSVPRDNHSWFRGRIVEVFDDLKYSIKQLHQHQQQQQQQQQQFSRC